MSKKEKTEYKANYLRIIGCIYLLSLSYQLFVRASDAEKPLFGLACAVVFVIVSILLLFYEWKCYREAGAMSKNRQRTEDNHVNEQKEKTS